MFTDLTNSGISVRLGEMWSKMTKDQKKPYFEEANRIKEQHKIDHPSKIIFLIMFIEK